MNRENVGFYRVLTLGVILVLLVASTIGCIGFGLSNKRLKKEMIGLTQQSKPAASTDMAVLSSDGKQMLEGTGAPLEYQKKYPDLYVQGAHHKFEPSPYRSVYLTFDDGPSAMTPAVLDILKQNNVKATFFVVYKGDENSKKLYNQMIADGHTVGVHTSSHKYKEIYKSVDSFLDDFEKTATMLKEVTGVAPTIFRFPGGSVNAYNSHIYQEIIAEMTRRGYTYYDWNVSSGDATGKAGKEQILGNVISGVSGKEKSIVLLHDGSTKINTVNALKEIIDILTISGYPFAPLNNTVEPFIFGYPS